jgi:hypothetical protein
MILGSVPSKRAQELFPPAQKLAPKSYELTQPGGKCPDYDHRQEVMGTAD